MRGVSPLHPLRTLDSYLDPRVTDGPCNPHESFTPIIPPMSKMINNEYLRRVYEDTWQKRGRLWGCLRKPRDRIVVPMSNWLVLTDSRSCPTHIRETQKDDQVVREEGVLGQGFPWGALKCNGTNRLGVSLWRRSLLEVSRVNLRTPLNE